MTSGTGDYQPPGRAATILLVVLGLAAIGCGLHAIGADSVTTPARFGGDTRVHGQTTLLIGAGWIAIGFSLLTAALAPRLGSRHGRPIAVGLAVVGGACWMIATT